MKEQKNKDEVMCEIGPTCSFAEECEHSMPHKKNKDCNKCIKHRKCMKITNREIEVPGWTKDTWV